MPACFCTLSSIRSRATLLATTFLMSGIFLSVHSFAQSAPAMPSGGNLVAGTATIGSLGGQTVISQSSAKAIINWTDFSIGQGGTVTFNNGDGATLNRVTGGNLSTIDGLLDATGSVYLINPNGVIIGKTGLVNVGGSFVASALDITNDNFLNGSDQTFAGPSLASVVNLGKIGALGGDVALMAVDVQNSGRIDAANGTVGLVAGRKIILRDASVGDGKFLVVTGGSDTEVTNDGAIAAASAELRAEGGNIYALAGNTSGVIRATAVSEKDGKVWLTAGKDGTINISGSAVTTTDANGDGGEITARGGQIHVASDATLDASATVTSGNGGRVKVIADMASGNLTFAGKALARAGGQGGNGGFVETSGATVDFNGARIDTSSPGGQGGNWLIDPYNLTIGSSAASTIATNLATTDVTLQTTASGTSAIGTASSGDGDIVINSGITWSSGNTLTLDAYHSVQFNANVTATGSGKAVIKTNNGGTGGDYYFAKGKSLSLTTGGSLNINGAAYTLIDSLAGIAGMTSSGRYALTSNITGGTYSNNVYTGTFSGAFTGLGHSIDSLTITSGGGDLALFYSTATSGVVRDLGVTNITIDSGGGSDASGVVAYNQGTIANVWTTGAISGSYAGGISAQNVGTIRNSFSSANIGSYGDTVGGLVGYNDPGGNIIDSYATGTVTNATGFAGGLVGQNAGNIATSYATGLVTGAGMNGGLVALDQGGTVTSSYWDTTTSGQVTSGLDTSNNPTSAGGAGLTTAQLQSGTLPSGFGSAWGATSGFYPYLTSFFGTAVTPDQKISGYAYNADGSAANAATVGIWSGGGSLGVSASTGANGYYYILVTPGTATSSTDLGGTLTLNGASSVSGLSYTNAPTLTGSDVTDFNIRSGLIDLTTGATSYSGLQTLLAGTFGSSTLSVTLAGITNPDYKITASGAFTLDSALTGGGAVSIKTGGDLTVNSAVMVGGSKALMLDAHDNLYVNANLTASGSNAVTLKSADGGSGDYYFALGDFLSFTGSGGSLNINGNAYTLLYSLSDFSSMEGSTGKFALAKSLDATASGYTASVVANFGTSSNHTGIFTGLGNTISNLNINTPSSTYTGLFGFNFGTVRDIGLIGGLVQGQYVGALVGYNYSGTIKNAFTSATVTGSGSVGGLAATNSGSISNSVATGAVIGGSTAGGLVAANYNGTITNSYASGPVYATAQSGGLAGINNGGTISYSFATGAVRGNGGKGGLAGNAIGGTITNSYYDSETTGAVNGLGTALTTAQLQSSLPTGFSASAWATGAGLYPYLKSFYPGGLQTITGTATNNSGTTASAAQVALYTGGAQLGSAYSGANGYYYIVVTPGAVTASTQVGAALTLNGASSVSGLSYTNAPSLSGSNVTGFNIKSGLIDLTTGAASYSSLKTLLGATFGSSALSSALAGISDPDYRISASGAFNFDQAVTFDGGLNMTAAGGITLSQDLTTGGDATFNNAVVLAGDTALTSGGALTFQSTINGAHALTLKGGSLDFGDAVGGTTALTSLTGEATTGNISVGGQITTTGAILLAANGSFSNTAGASALNAGDGFTVYTQNAADPTGTMPVNSFDGLTATNYYNDAYNFTTGAFATSVPTGNHFVYAYAASVAPTLSGSATKTYDAGLTADTSGLTLGRTLLSADDSVTFTIGSASYDTKNAGTGKTVTANVSLSSNPNNYTLDISTASAAIGTINKAALTLAAITGTKTYDATTTSGGTVSVTGLQGSDTVSGLTQSYDSKNAGSRTLGVNGGYVVNDGNSGGNYTVTTQTASGTINKAALTLAAITGTKTYDATNTSSGTVTVSGLQGSDTVSGLTQSYDSKNAGSRILGVNGGYVVNDGNGGGNYTVTTQTASGTINRAALTLAAITGTKTYDATNTSSGTVTVSGLQGTDTVSGLSQSYDSKNAGSRTLGVNGGYVINDGNSGGNYTVTTQTASGTINRAALTLAAITGTKTYDATNASSGTVTVTGLQGTDTVSGLSQSYDSKNAGSRTLGVNGGYVVNDGNSGGNYTITTQTTVGTINRAALTLAAVTETKTYDATTTSGGTVTVSGLQGSDTATGLSQSYDSKNAGSRTLAVNGGYVVNDGNGGGNYSVTTQTAVGAIDKAVLVAGLTGTVEKTYDATSDAGLTSANYNLSGVFGSDDVALNEPASGSYADKNAGTGKTVSVSGLALLGSDAGNYNVNGSASGAVGTINKAALTLAAVTETKTYDATTTSGGTVTVSGLQGSDTATGLSQSYDSKNAGSRTLAVNGGYVVNDGNGGGNYSVTTQTAVGAIDKAVLVAGLTGTVEKTYDATTDADLTKANYSLTGVFGSDDVELNDPASGSYDDKNAGTGKTVSVSGLALVGSDAGNYTVNTSAAGAMGMIDRRAIAITADHAGKISGGSDPLLTWQMTLGSLAGNDTITGGLARATGENPGDYAITQGSLAASNNYAVTFTGAKFTITPAGMQNQPVVNPVQSSLASPTVIPSAFTDNSGSDSGSSTMAGGDTGTSDGSSGAGDPDATGPDTNGKNSSSTTCTDGGACANQPYPGNQTFSSYVSFLSQ